MSKFLFTEVRTPPGEDTSALVWFTAIKLDDIFQTIMDQRFRIMFAANVVAQAQGSKIESIKFEDRRPFLVSRDQNNRSMAHRRFCELVSEGIDDHAMLGTPYITEVSSDFVHKLNSEFPLVSTLDIDMDGYAFTWTLMFKHSIWEAYVSYPSLFMSMGQLSGGNDE